MTNESNGGQEFFDDCPICQAMKKAKEKNQELPLSELKKAFKQAKENGAVTGGDEL